MAEIPLNNGKQSTASLIVKILGKEFPLTAKEIHHRLKREFASTASYQAVHKALSSLSADGLLEKSGSEYRLSEKYISNVKKMGEDIESFYKGDKFDFNKDVVKYFSLNRYADMCRFVIDFFFEAPDDRGRDSWCLFKHVYSIVGLTDEEYEKMKKICADVNHCAIAKCGTPMDKYFGEFLEKMGKRVKVGVDYGLDGDFFVCGDFVLQVFLSADLEKEIERIYKTKVIDGEGLEEMFKSYLSKNTDIGMLIVKDAEFADSLREKARKAFGLK